MLLFSNVMKKVVKLSIFLKILLGSQSKAISEWFAVYFAVPQLAEKAVSSSYTVSREHLQTSNFCKQCKMKYSKMCRCVLGNSVSVTAIFDALIMKLSELQFSLVVPTIILLFWLSLKKLYLYICKARVGWWGVAGLGFFGDFRRQNLIF